MSGEIMAENALLAILMALFAITPPIAAVPLFVAATAGQSEPERRRTALIAAATYEVAGMVALLAGNAALSFFGVSVAALRLVGMAVVAVIGWQMINAPTAVADRWCKRIGATPRGFKYADRSI
jgi:multiple antibiotic resistance protein